MRRRTGRPRQSWLRTIENDLRPLNLGLATAKRRAQDRLTWWLLVTWPRHVNDKLLNDNDNLSYAGIKVMHARIKERPLPAPLIQAVFA